MRILHVVAPAGIGGIERVVQLLSTAQHAAGDASRVVAVSSEGESDLVGQFLQPIAEAGVPTSHVVVPPRGYGREREMLREICRGARPDVVHTHGYRVDVVDGFGFRHDGLPTVSTAHGFVGGGLRNRGYEWLQRRALRFYHGVAAVSRSVARRLVGSGVPESRIRILPNAWHATSPSLTRAAARAQLGLQESQFHIGWVGRIEQEKGLDVMLAALAAIQRAPCHLSVIGDGSLAALMRRRAMSLHVADRVSWHGPVALAERYLIAFDALVLSSRTEGVPMVLLEAMAAELPVVATSVGGVPDTISTREALLVPPGRPEAIAEAVQRVWADPASAAWRARAARARVQQEFGVDAWVRNYRSLYLDAMTRAVAA
jgi:glycosyltransferase involved in cell wall biosynthesis